MSDRITTDSGNQKETLAKIMEITEKASVEDKNYAALCVGLHDTGEGYQTHAAIIGETGKLLRIFDAIFENFDSKTIRRIVMLAIINIIQKRREGDNEDEDNENGDMGSALFAKLMEMVNNNGDSYDIDYKD